MYIWNLRALLEDLKENRVSSKSEMGYLIVFVIISSLSFLIADINSAEEMKRARVDEFITLIVSCIGIIFCYTANKEFDSKDFIKRLICIWLPSSIRYLIFFAIPVIIAVLVAGELLGGWPRSIESKYIDGGRGIAIMEGLYWFYVYGAFQNLKPEEQTSKERTKQCQYCAETILEEAIVCKHCNRELA